MASCCHLSMDLFVPRDEGCAQEKLRISGFSSLLVFRVPKKFSGGTVTAVKPSSHRGRAVTERRGMWRQNWREKERERQVKVSKEDLRVSSL